MESIVLRQAQYPSAGGSSIMLSKTQAIPLGSPRRRLSRVLLVTRVYPDQEENIHPLSLVNWTTSPRWAGKVGLAFCGVVCFQFLFQPLLGLLRPGRRGVIDLHVPAAPHSPRFYRIPTEFPVASFAAKTLAVSERPCPATRFNRHFPGTPKFRAIVATTALPWKTR